MELDPKPIADERPLTREERLLGRWMLEHSTPEARSFLPQLERARVVSRCACGCASIDFEVEGHPPPTGGLRILGDFEYGGECDLSGVFIFECNGVLAGIEVYGLAADTPMTLPVPAELRPLNTSPDD